MTHVPLREASTEKKLLPEPGLYRHFKGGQYELLTVAHHSETEELLVIYRAVDDPSKIWVRPLEMFTEIVECQEGTFLRFAPYAIGRSGNVWSPVRPANRFTWDVWRRIWDAARTRHRFLPRARTRVG